MDKNKKVQKLNLIAQAKSNSGKCEQFSRTAKLKSVRLFKET